MTEDLWRTANRANWDERVAVHLAPGGYDLAPLRSGHGRLDSIVEQELPPIAGKRVLHLQCHLGNDSLTLAQRGAHVTGLDFSAPAIEAARTLARQLHLEATTSFVQADLYDAPTAIPQPRAFDLVYVTWGAICWLPDIHRWAEVVAHFIKPGGFLYLADAHPAALIFDDLAPLPDNRPGYFVPYFQTTPIVLDDARDYANPAATLKNTRQYTFMHPLGQIVTALIKSGLTLDWLHEHDRIPWRMFATLVQDHTGAWRWPDQPWLPLAFSLLATR